MKRLCFLLLVMLFVSHEALAGVPGFMKKNMGTISGTVLTDEGKPLPGGIVSFFNSEGGPPPMWGGIQRVPEFVGRVDTEGKFSVKLVPGKYYMGALIITDPQRGPGPPKPGESFFFAANDKGGLWVLEVAPRSTKDVGTITTAKSDAFPASKDYFTVEGIVQDDQGKPFPQTIIMVKAKPNDFRPIMVSERTGKDGRFKLQLPPGTYYLMSRQVADKMPVGRPLPGNYVGTYGKEVPKEEVPDDRFGPPPGIELPKGAGLEGKAGPPAGVGVPGGVGKLGGVTALPVTGKKGDTIKDVTIKMAKIPDPGKLREQLKAASKDAEEKK